MAITLREAKKLPKGNLFIQQADPEDGSFFDAPPTEPAEFTDADLRRAVRKLRRKKDKAPVATQAQLIAIAGNAYRAFSGLGSKWFGVEMFSAA